MAQRLQSAVWNSIVKSARMLDKADGSIYNEGTANTDEVFCRGKKMERPVIGRAGVLPAGKGLRAAWAHGRPGGNGNETE